MDCKTCKENKPLDLPYIVHEADMARMERSNKRLWIAIILLIVLLVGSNCAWIYYENQFTDEIVTVEQDADENGTNNFIGHDGEIRYGEAESYSEEPNP